MDLDAKLERESQFWDARQHGGEARDPALYRVSAADRDDRSVPWLPYVGFREHVQLMLDRIGPLEGRRVLDLGCGSGFVSCLLAANGAQVDAVDVSEASLEIARWRADISGVSDRIRFHKAPAEELPVEDQAFDAACGAFVLHHLDLKLAGAELHRVLRTGARGAFIETSGGSALLMAARRLLPGRFGIEKASSDDEAPLDESAARILAGQFGDSVRVEQPATLFFKMLSYIAPLHKSPAREVWAVMDKAMHAIPPLRRQSYYCVVSFQKAENRTLSGAAKAP